MTRFTAERGRLGAQPTVVLSDAGGRRATIALHGAVLLGLRVPYPAGTLDIAWGYRSDAQILARAGSRFAILAPFGGRIADARYTFDRTAFDLQPGVTGSRRGFRHGFVRDADFAVAELLADPDSARATLTTTAIRPRPGYPFAIDLALDFTLAASGLTLAAHLHNVGAHAAPCFFGWHAYFRVGRGRVDDWTLRIPARTTIAADARLIALPGRAAHVPLDTAPALDFRRARRISDQVLDTGFADLAMDRDGRTRTRLADPVTGVALEVWQERGILHAFTGDTLGVDARSAIALEPMECMADAFNRPECAAAIRLDAGATRTFRCGVACPVA